MHKTLQFILHNKLFCALIFAFLPLIIVLELIIELVRGEEVVLLLELSIIGILILPVFYIYFLYRIGLHLLARTRKMLIFFDFLLIIFIGFFIFVSFDFSNFIFQTDSLWFIDIAYLYWFKLGLPWIFATTVLSFAVFFVPGIRKIYDKPKLDSDGRDRIVKFDRAIFLVVGAVFVIFLGGLETKAQVKMADIDCGLTSQYLCQADADCLCREHSGCYRGNKYYLRKCHQQIKFEFISCSDYCEGWNIRPLKCINNQCTSCYGKCLEPNY